MMERSRLYIIVNLEVLLCQFTDCLILFLTCTIGFKLFESDSVYVTGHSKLTEKDMVTQVSGHPAD